MAMLIAEAIHGISVVVAILDACANSHTQAPKEARFFKVFNIAAKNIRTLASTLRRHVDRLKSLEIKSPNASFVAIEDTLYECGRKARELHLVYKSTSSAAGDGWDRRCAKALNRIGKGTKIELLVKSITGDVHHIVKHDPIKSDQRVQDGSAVHPERKMSNAIGINSFLCPFARDPNLVVRDSLISAEEHLSCPGARVALAGMGGTGKSHTAIELAYRLHASQKAAFVFWVHAASIAKFEASYRRIAEALKLPERHDPTPKMLKAVLQWLNSGSHGRWMLILDNADDVRIFGDIYEAGNRTINPDTSGSLDSSLTQYLPICTHGSILVTTRSKKVGALLTGLQGETISTGQMTRNEALQLLRNRLQSCGRYNAKDATVLVKQLEYIPLAISQAAAFIRRDLQHNSLRKYSTCLREIARSKSALFTSNDSKLPRDYHAVNSILSTWQISFDHLQATIPSAAELLCLLTFFSRESIPELNLGISGSSADVGDDQIQQQNRHWAKAFRLEADSNQTHLDASKLSWLTIEHDYDVLQEYGLIHANLERNTFSMHAFVHFAMGDWLRVQGEYEIFYKRFTRAFDHFLKRKVTVREYHAVEVHVDATFKNKPIGDLVLPAWMSLLYRASAMAFDNEDYTMAERLIRELLQYQDQTPTLDISKAFKLSTDLGAILFYTGKYEWSEQMQRSLLKAAEDTLRIDSLSVFRCKNHLAVLLSKFGRFDEASELLSNMYDQQSQLLGSDHKATLATKHNLAFALYEAGEQEVATRLLATKQVQSDDNTSQGSPSSSRTLQTPSPIAQDEDYPNLELSRQFSQKTLTGHATESGKPHPRSSKTLYNLGCLCEKMRLYDSALAYFQCAMGDWEALAGPRDPNTLICSRAVEKVRRKIMDEQRRGAQSPSTTASSKSMDKTFAQETVVTESLSRTCSPEQFDDNNSQEDYGHSVLAELPGDMGPLVDKTHMMWKTPMTTIHELDGFPFHELP